MSSTSTNSNGKNWCLDADASSGSLNDGAKVQLWECHPEYNNQEWYVTSTGRLLNQFDYAVHSYCLDVDLKTPAA